MVRALVVLVLSLTLSVGCSSPPDHVEGVDHFLATETEVDPKERALTGIWTADEGEQVLLVQAGDLIGALALDGPTRATMHFGEGHLDGEQLSLLPYRQGVRTEASVGGLDAGTPREATLRRAEEAFEFATGASWRRVASVPGTGALVGIWRSSAGGRLAVAHEGERVLACALDGSVRDRFAVAHARLAEDGRLWTVFVQGGRPVDREIGRLGAEEGVILWQDGRTWKLDAHLQGAPPAPPLTLTPADRGELPNSVEGVLSWSFDWSDVTGATEYRLEVNQEDSPRAFVQVDGIEASEYVHTRSGGSLARTRDWTWRVAAKVGGEWTDWSRRSRFEITED